ncbi:hypothetical protein LWI28_007382 [Acer negundo]|uniref:RNase H type-1 domain-containing protein n=1 Tax=Acer negundo TaxID=4023 RepID=A0AAD5J481_ACENE|nr:hypothetical protein LWI28_007382 [Acer negundo]
MILTFCLDIFCWLSLNAPRKELESIAMLVWRIWFNRNLIMHNKQGKESDVLYCWAMDLLAEFQGTRSALSPTPSPPSSANVAWCPPPPGQLKLNTDVAVFQGRDVFGVGAVIRNSEGGVVLALSKLKQGCFSVMCVKLWPFVKAWSWLDNMGWLCVGLRWMPPLLLLAIPRGGNSLDLAHRLASLAVSLWHGSCPGLVRPRFVDEMRL